MSSPSCASSSALPLRVALLALGLSVGCSPTPQSTDAPSTEPTPTPASAPLGRSHFTYPLIAVKYATSSEPRDQDAWWDFQTRSPLEFLRRVELDGPRPNDPFAATLTFSNIHRGWIRREDLPALLARFDDDAPAHSLMLASCSMFPTRAMTVGDHAALLVQGYRHDVEALGYGGYPPVLSSDWRDEKESVEAWARAQLEE